MAINVDVARAGAPLLNLRGVTDVRQPAATAAQKDELGMLGNLLAGSSAPMTQQQKMRRDIGGLFGVDTRSPMEKLREQLADMPLKTAADYANAAQVAKDLGLTAQAIQLSQKSAQLGETEEKTRVATEATVAGRAAEAQRVIATMENTTDPRIMKELQGLIPSVAQGTLAGADLTTAIDKVTSSYQMERMTEAEGTRYEGLVAADERLSRLTTEPGIIAKVFGADASPAIAQAVVVDEIHRQRQLDPVAPMTTIIDRTIDELQTKVNEGMGFDSPDSRVSTTPPLETVSTGIPFVPAGQGMTGEEQRAYLEEQKASTQQQVAEINRRVQAQLDEEDRQGRRPRTAKERSNRAEELRYLMFKQQGMDLRPFGIPSAAGPL
jgi:hypothetical protein